MCELKFHLKKYKLTGNLIFELNRIILLEFELYNVFFSYNRILFETSYINWALVTYFLSYNSHVSFLIDKNIAAKPFSKIAEVKYNVIRDLMEGTEDETFTACNVIIKNLN